MSGYIQVQVSAPSREEGLRITRSVIGARLAACAQVLGPMTSTYWWRDEIQVDEEYLLLMKTPAEHYPDLEAHIREQHSYSVAEIIATPISSGLSSYLRWMDEETRAPGVG